MNEIPITVRAERQSAVYRIGEVVRFQVTGAGENFRWRIDDGVTVTEPAPLSAPEIVRTADAPGFLLVELLSEDQVVARGGAAIEPEKIRPGVKTPADFAAFWSKELAAMREAKRELLQKEPIPAKYLPAGFVGYDVAVRQGDVTATGYLVMPADAKPGALPAVMNFNGASKVSAELPVAVDIAKTNRAISFNLNFHGLANFNLTEDRDREREEKVKPQVASYQFDFADDPRRYALRKIFLRVALAADFVRDLPEFDGRNLVAVGGSLGGCQAIVCAALVPEVVYCISNATAMCDHFGRDAGHLPGWPDLLAHNPAAATTAAYFDVVNFAGLVRCPTRMAVGFIDTTCPPASTYAAHNNLGTADKEMRHTVTGGHGGAQDPRDINVFDQHMADLKKVLAALKG